MPGDKKDPMFNPGDARKNERGIGTGNTTGTAPTVAPPGFEDAKLKFQKAASRPDRAIVWLLNNFDSIGPISPAPDLNRGTVVDRSDRDAGLDQKRCQSAPGRRGDCGIRGMIGQAELLDAGVDHLADIRDKPMSRKPDFRAAALRARCEAAGIEYGAWPELGSTEAQRERLRETGDLAAFRKAFRAYARRSLNEPLSRLERVAKAKSVALLCYERLHEECHRSVVADLLAERIGAGVVAIV